MDESVADDVLPAHGKVIYTPSHCPGIEARQTVPHVRPISKCVKLMQLERASRGDVMANEQVVLFLKKGGQEWTEFQKTGKVLDFSGAPFGDFNLGSRDFESLANFDQAS